MIRSLSLLFVSATALLAGCCQSRCPRPCSPSPCCPPIATAAAPQSGAVLVVPPPAPAPSAVGLEAAVRAALVAAPGEAIEAGIEDETNGGVTDTFIEVMILDATGAAIEVKIDPATGRVRTVGKSPDADEAQELGAIAKRLPAPHLALADLIHRAAGAGEPAEAGFVPEAGGGLLFVATVGIGAGKRHNALDPATGAAVTRTTHAEADEAEEDNDDEKSEKPKVDH